MFTQTNFLIRLKNIITGQTDGNGHGVGFVKSVPISLTELKTSAGLTLTAGTSPLLAALETNHPGLQWAAGNATAALLNWIVPNDYDEISDTLTIAIIANSAGNTNNPTLGATIYQKRVGTALSADLAPTASSAIPKSASPAAIAAERTIVCAGKGLKGGDVLTILIAPGTHATDAVNVYGLSLRYKSCIVAFDPALR